jgi:predicted NAD-dependent protein-ADP-ribosyltransferase YbiA (DUF1768 family)
MKQYLSTALLTLTLTTPVLADRSQYPAEWFAPVPRDQAASWEILPQDAGEGEVILSKRTALGILSNFASTPFALDGRRYEAVEGFWQMMKFPENDQDPRAKVPGVTWPHTRDQVAQMVAFEAKDAGKFGSDVMKKMGINWVTYLGRQLEYRTPQKGEHYNLIVRAMWAKLEANPEVKKILLRTGDLILKPDHQQEADASPAWKYNEIWMDIRAQLAGKKS